MTNYDKPSKLADYIIADLGKNRPFSPNGLMNERDIIARLNGSDLMITNTGHDAHHLVINELLKRGAFEHVTGNTYRCLVQTITIKEAFSEKNYTAPIRRLLPTDKVHKVVSYKPVIASPYPKILILATEYFCCTIDDILNKNRGRDIAYRRFMVQKAIRELSDTEMSFDCIGDIFKQDHSSVIYAVARVDQVASLKESYDFFSAWLKRKIKKAGYKHAA